MEIEDVTVEPTLYKHVVKMETSLPIPHNFNNLKVRCQSTCKFFFLNRDDGILNC